MSRAGESRSGVKIYLCDVSPRVGSSGSGRSDDSVFSSCDRIQDLSDNGFGLQAVNGMESGIVFQRRDPGGVGNQKVIDMGYMDAVDVW